MILFIIQYNGKIMKTKNFFTKPLRSLKNEDKFICALLFTWIFLCVWTKMPILYAIAVIYIEDKFNRNENKEKDLYI